MKIESEIKYGLAGAEDYRRLCGPGGLAGPDGRSGSGGLERQENHYLDTADHRLSRERAMLRIRSLRPGEGTLTLKRGREEAPGFFRSTELEAPLPPGALSRTLESPSSVYRLDLAPVAELRAQFGELPLELIGTLATERRLYRTAGFLVELDRITFPDGSTEHEVEIETESPDKARAWLEEEFQRLGVNAAPSRETKFARLLRRLSSR